MNKIVYLIFVISLLLLLNIGVYFYNDNYVSFLKKIKYGDGINEDIINDEYLLNSFEIKENNCNCEEFCKTNLKNSEENNIIDVKQVINNKVLENKELERQNYEKINQVLEKFSKYNLRKIEYDEYYNIFDITDEYPDNYITYKNNGIEIYFFLGGTFENIYEMFDLIGNEETTITKFNLKKVNNFGKKTFFINKKELDNYVRIIVDNGNILFGLKIKKTYYGDIKKILQNF